MPKRNIFTLCKWLCVLFMMCVRRQWMVAFECNSTVGEVGSTNRSEVMFVDFGLFAPVVFGLIEI